MVVVDRISISTSDDALIFSQLRYFKRACLSILTMTQEAHHPIDCRPVYVTLEQGRPIHLLVVSVEGIGQVQSYRGRREAVALSI